MPDAAPDPYTIRDGEAHRPPNNLRARLKYLGPSVIVAGSIVGSGELILTSSLGAVAGFTLLWWMLVSCWSKSLVQAELARYIVVSGDTYLRALNRVPGRIGPISWPVWISLINTVAAITALGGILGGAGQALALLFPAIDAMWATAGVALVAMGILGSGSYKWLERVMLVLVMSFTLATLVCAVAMQFTEFRTTPAEILSGFTFHFPLEYIALALAAYGYTGVNSGEIAGYTYWCIEKGYPSFIGADRDDPDWVAHARGWMKVLHTDVWLTLAILTCATLPYYILGAGVLHEMDLHPSGIETISVLSNMFTQTLGPWAVWIFGTGAFFILASTVLSGIGAGGRVIPDYLIEMGLFDRSNLRIRYAVTRGYVMLLPVVGFLIYLWVKNPVVLVMIGGLMTAFTTPVQTGATIWLQAARMDQRIRPGTPTRIGLWAIFLFQVVMAGLVMWFVVIKPRLG